MKNYKRKIILDFDYEKVKEGVPRVNDQMKILNAEYRATQAEVKVAGTELDKFTTRQKYLEERIKSLNDVLTENKQRFQEAVEKHGEGSKQAQHYNKEIKITEAQLKELESDLKGVNKKIEEQATFLGMTGKQWDSLGDKATAVGKSMTAKITVPALAAGGAAFKLSSDYEQAMGKVDVVFEKGSRRVKEWASNSLESFGLARTTATQMAGDFGAMFKGIGISYGQTEKWSMELTERVMDMSNFYDTTTEETINALNAIVTGQTEPLRRFGINMNQATLQEYAYANGMQKKIADMTEAEKVQLRYNFVMERTTMAVGTTARESDSATGQMNRMKEVVKELGLNFGEILLPVIVPFLESINNVLMGFNSLDDSTKQLIVKLLAFAATLGPILMMFGKMIDTVKGVSDGLKVAKEGFEAVKAAGGILSFLSTSTQGFGMAKVIGYALALAAALATVALAFDLIFRGGKGVQGMMSSIGSVFGNQTQQIQQAQGAINQAGLRGYAVGTNYLTEDQPIYAHKGEAIIPEQSNPWNPNATKPFGFGGGDTFILQFDAERIRTLLDLENLLMGLKQAARAGEL